MRPKLKDVAWERVGDDLRIVYDRRDQFMVTDPGGVVERMLGLLCEGVRTPAGIAEALQATGDEVSAADVADALAAFDEYGLVEDADRLGTFDPAATERYFSNLAFFESFASLDRSREDLQHRLRSAHVLVLGTGGLNSNTIPHLCGMGVGRLTLMDRDAVEPRNFARQYLYRWQEIGQSKVERAAAWVTAFDPSIKVEALTRSLDGPAAIDEVIQRAEPDLVLAGVDSPVQIDDWMNTACVGNNVPYIRGGMYVTQGIIWSVDPGASACRHCADVTLQALEPGAEEAESFAAVNLFRTKPRTNRGIGPVAGVLGSLVSFEALRYLTRFEEPAYAGAPLYIDFAAGCATEQVRWQREASCPTCG
jgi:molybdopterin/thiamine biosynthesis adenylyltransferase